MLLIYVFTSIVFVFGLSDAYDCPLPKLTNGKFKVRVRSKLVRFACFTGYELVGNKYAICRDGVWDVTHPVCVKAGCPPIDDFPHGLTISSRNGAWIMFFCVPEHKLIGSSALYCDGRKWNASVPMCVDYNTPSALSCDFEEANICGWTQDNIHDFDWKRLNKATPSSMLFTGPSFDHTYGKNGSGYYMYIESTGRLRNETARLLSPIYDLKVSRNACFSFYYHMYGQGIGGLKVYQKPDSVTLTNSMKHQYVIFEKWSSQGDMWHNAVVPLTELNEDFQLMVEGIRGASFTSDIAIDDVAILQGDACVQSVTTTTELSFDAESCENKCDVALVRGNCGCSEICVSNGNCCPDFFDVCLYNSDTTVRNEQYSTNQTGTVRDELIKVTTVNYTTKPTTRSNRNPIQTTTSKTTTTIKTIPNTTQPKLSTTSKPIQKPTPVIFKTTPINNITTKSREITKVTPLILKTTVVVKTTTVLPKIITNDDRKILAVEKAKENKELAIDEAGKQHITKIVTVQPKAQSSIKTGFIVITSLMACCFVVLILFASRTSRGREIIAKIKGRTMDDQEVRFLTANVDVDD